MSSVAVFNPSSGSRTGLARLAFPALRVRFAIALLLTFFPCGILYPLVYPAGEILTLGCWVWVFPSPIGCLSLLLMPLCPDPTYGYWAFNLLCTLSCLSVAFAASRCRAVSLADLVFLHRFARRCMVVSLAIAALQAMTDPGAWMAVFTDMRLETGRGAGLRLEPSQLSSLLALHLGLVACRIQAERRAAGPLAGQRALLREAVLAMVLSMALTRSLSVVIVALCFLPALFLNRRHLRLLLAAAGLGGVAGMATMGDRIRDAFLTSGGSLGDLITAGVDSWRNVPDLLILSNPGDFLIPGRPAEVRDKIHILALIVSPVSQWVQNTFSSFSASAVTVGLLLTALLMAAGLVHGMRSLAGLPSLRLTWLMAFITAWFFIAKWDPSVWIALGLLPLGAGIRLPAGPQKTARLAAPVAPGPWIPSTPQTEAR